MNALQKVSRLLALASTGVIMACGGGAGSSGGVSGNNGNSSSANQPSRAPANASTFLSLASNGNCADVRNRFYLIDKQYVYQDRAGNCADASYSRVLYGANPNEKLCYQADSIRGPVSECSGELKAFFDGLNSNRERPNLGLSASHSVTPLVVGTPVATRQIDFTRTSGIENAQNLVIQDSNAWASLWAQHSRNLSPAPALPSVDFSKKMLVAVFAGKKPNGCFGVDDGLVERINSQIKVSYRDVSSETALCTQHIATPGLILEIDRSSDAVVFSNDRFAVAATSVASIVAGVDIPWRQLDNIRYSGITNAQNLLIRDSATLARMWRQHAPYSNDLFATVPSVDFARRMVLMVALGRQSSGCIALYEPRVTQFNNQIQVRHNELRLPKGVACTEPDSIPTMFLEIDASDSQVVFFDEPARIIEDNFLAPD